MACRPVAAAGREIPTGSAGPTKWRTTSSAAQGRKGSLCNHGEVFHWYESGMNQWTSVKQMPAKQKMEENTKAYSGHQISCIMYQEEQSSYYLYAASSTMSYEESLDTSIGSSGSQSETHNQPHSNALLTGSREQAVALMGAHVPRHHLALREASAGCSEQVM